MQAFIKRFETNPRARSAPVVTWSKEVRIKRYNVDGEPGDLESGEETAAVRGVGSPAFRLKRAAVAKHAGDALKRARLV